MQPWASGPQLAIGTPTRWRDTWDSDAIPCVCTHRKTPFKAERLVKVRRRLQKAKSENCPGTQLLAQRSRPGHGDQQREPSACFFQPREIRDDSGEERGARSVQGFSPVHLSALLELFKMHLPSSNDAQMVPALPSGAGEVSQEGQVGVETAAILLVLMGLFLMPEVRETKCHHSSPTQEEQVDCFLGPASPNICLRPWPSNSTIRTGGDAYGFTREDSVDVRTQLNVMTVNICRGAGPSEGYRAMLQGRAKEE